VATEPIANESAWTGSWTRGSLLLLLGLSLACAPADSGSASKTIGVSLLTRAHVFYRDLEDGLRAGAEAHGYELLVNAAEWDAGRQISQLEDFGREGIVIVGYDATPPARDAILKGRALKADVVQHPFQIGSRTIETIASHFAGQEVPAVHPVEVDIVDRKKLLALEAGAVEEE
jgi:ABC-type sugar transport system substrate-binding protein